MPPTRVRVVGSGFTSLQYNGKDIAFMESFTDTGQRAAGEASQAITPLGARHPVEIVTGRVLDAGQITASVRELWNEPVWWQLQGLAGTHTIVDLWEALAAASASVTCQMLIRPPVGPVRGKVYHGCVVTHIDDNETVTVGQLSMARNIIIAYTHTTAV